MAKIKRIILPAVGGILLIISGYPVMTYFTDLDHRVYFYITLFHASVFLFFVISLYVVSLRNSRKILFSFLIWSGLKIILSGLFFAFLVGFFAPAGLKSVTFYFLATYLISLIFEVWTAHNLLKV